MSNTKKVSCKTAKVIRSAFFRKGFEDAHRGLPFSEVGSPRDQWNYERGRLFAACFKGTLKVRNRVRVEAMYEFNNAVNSGAII